MKIRILNLLLVLTLGLFISCNNDDNSTQQIEELNFTGEIESSSDFFVSKLLSSENLKTAITINGAGRENLNLTSEYTTFSLPNNDINIEVSKWNIDVNGYFTNDAPFEIANKLESWNAISGSIKIIATNIEITEFETYYQITLQLENIVFENNSGEQKIITNLIIENANVGWLPG
mgnify:CR=1 FL=1|tara:strand:- start:258 stop:785 length:528 start_codon:yes stop_codon:yes gene_type:complete